MLEWISLIAGILVDLIVGGFGLLILYRIARNDIKLDRLISEPNGDASMSRFQLLVFTIVVGLALFVVTTAGSEPHFPELPGSILALLGISASSYLVSKGIQFSNPDAVKPKPDAADKSQAAGAGGAGD